MKWSNEARVWQTGWEYVVWEGKMQSFDHHLRASDLLRLGK